MCEDCCEGTGRKCAWFGGICFFVVALVVMILILCAIQTVDVGFLGLDMNSITNEVNTQVTYTEGRYLNGLGHSMVLYPRFAKIIDFTGDQLTVRSGDGQSVKLELSFDYILDATQIGSLFTRFGMQDYEVNFRSKAQSEVLRVAGFYNATMFFTNRTDIGDVMHTAVDIALRTVCASVPWMQMRGIAVPDNLESALINTEVSRQKVVTQENINQAATIRAQKSIIDSNTTAMIQQINATAAAAALVIVKSAEANATTIRLAAEQAAAASMKNSLGFNNTQLLKYMYTQALAAQPGAEFYLGLNTQIIHT